MRDRSLNISETFAAREAERRLPYLLCLLLIFGMSGICYLLFAHIISVLGL
jgi:hypothetical protein